MNGEAINLAGDRAGRPGVGAERSPGLILCQGFAFWGWAFLSEEYANTKKKASKIFQS